jgi:hypothetical protein
MLALKPLSSDWSEAAAKIPAINFIALWRFDKPKTCTHVRLLGPCFKTGQMEPFCHQVPQMVPPVDLRLPSSVQNTKPKGTVEQPHAQSSAFKGVLPHSFIIPRNDFPLSGISPSESCQWQQKAKSATQQQNQATCQSYDEPDNLKLQCAAILLFVNWFHSLSFQQVQALLALFSKSFSSFPHGTCVLSVLNQYWALDGIYHPLCAPIPRNVTFREPAVHKGLQRTSGTLTLSGTLFQDPYICALVGKASTDNTSGPEAPIIILSFSLFIRHYWGNPV